MRSGPNGGYRRLRVLALMPTVYGRSPGQRFRLEQWEPFLRHEGIEVQYEPFESEQDAALLHEPGRIAAKGRSMASGFVRRADLMRRDLTGFDLAYVFRETSPIGPAIFERWLARRSLPFVYDFDDAVFVPYRSPSNGYLSYLKYPQKTKTACALACHVMAGNAYLAAYARRFTDRVSIVPTTIDLERHAWQARPANDELVIGWTGSHSTLQHLEMAVQSLQALARLQRFKLMVIGAQRRLAPRGLDMEFVPWRASSEIEDLRRIDIGIMPLPNDRWTRGKCGLKILQFMALGIPTVSSPVGVNPDIVEHGVNGFLAATDEEWVRCLSALLESFELRQRIGQAGRRTVAERFSIQKHAPRIAEILRTPVTPTAHPSVEHGSLP